MKEAKITYIVTTVDGRSHLITADKADEALYDSFSFNIAVVDANTKERINPAHIITIRKC